MSAWCSLVWFALCRSSLLNSSGFFTFFTLSIYSFLRSSWLLRACPPQVLYSLNSLLSFLFSSPCHRCFFASRLPRSSLCLIAMAHTQEVFILLETAPEAVYYWLLAHFVLFTSPVMITAHRYPSANERPPVWHFKVICSQSLSRFLSFFGFILSFVVGSSETPPCWAESCWLLRKCLGGPSVCRFCNTPARFSGNSCFHESNLDWCFSSYFYK